MLRLKSGINGNTQGTKYNAENKVIILTSSVFPGPLLHLTLRVYNFFLYYDQRLFKYPIKIIKSAFLILYIINKYNFKLILIIILNYFNNNLVHFTILSYFGGEKMENKAICASCWGGTSGGAILTMLDF